ncbi:MAG: HNH endonuclease [Antricoccus sp.]
MTTTIDGTRCVAPLSVAGPLTNQYRNRAATLCDTMNSADRNFVHAVTILEQIEKLQAVLAAVQIEAEGMLHDTAGSVIGIDSESSEVPGGLRSHRSDRIDDRWVTRLEVAAAEFAPLAGISRRTAQLQIADAVAARQSCPQALAMLGRSEISAQHLSILQCEASRAELTGEQLRQVQVRVLVQPHRMRSVFRQQVRKAIAAVLGSWNFRATRKKTAAQRYFRVEIDGDMAYLSGLVGATEGAAIRETLKECAKTAAPEDPRTHTQKEADTLVALVIGPGAFHRLHTEHWALFDDDGRYLNTRTDESNDVADIVNDIRDLAAQINITIPRVPQSLISISLPVQLVDESNCLGAHIRLPSGHLVALGDALLDSRHIIDAELMQMILTDARWRRIVADAVGGQVLDVGTTVYRAPEAMKRRVRERDQRCQWVGCSRAAEQCDIDHVVPAAVGGSTADHNLQCLCRAHHRLKHQTTWRQSTVADGSRVWTSPTDRCYV